MSIWTDGDSVLADGEPAERTDEPREAYWCSACETFSDTSTFPPRKLRVLMAVPDDKGTHRTVLLCPTCAGRFVDSGRTHAGD